MARLIRLRLNPDQSSLGFNNNKLVLKISSKTNNGLSLSGGKLIATKAPDGASGSGGTMNTPGNALGPTTATENTSLPKVGCNSTVSRHKKYSGTDTFITENDGPVITKVVNESLPRESSIASFMIYKSRGEWIE